MATVPEQEGKVNKKKYKVKNFYSIGQTAVPISCRAHVRQAPGDWWPGSSCRWRGWSLVQAVLSLTAGWLGLGLWERPERTH